MENNFHPSGITVRLIQVRDHYKLTQKVMANAMQIVPSSLNRQLLGLTIPSFEALNSLLSTYPELNGDWLLTGRGAMLASETDAQTDQTIAHLQQEVSNLRKTIQEIIGAMAYLPGRDLTGQPVLPDLRAHKQPGSKLPRNRYAGLRHIELGSLFGGERAAA